MECFVEISSPSLSFTVVNIGASISSIKIKDKSGITRDVVLGFNDTKSYNENPAYFGSICGRVCNRIKEGKFSLPSEPHKIFNLPINNNGNSLHGGLKGFSHRIWTVVAVDKGTENPFIKLEYKSEDGEEGYPGNILVYVTYTLMTLTNSINIDYQCKSLDGKETIVNLTNHTYFNLSGVSSILNSHHFKIHSNSSLEVSNDLIPTGKFKTSEVDKCLDDTDCEYDTSFLLPINNGDHPLSQLAFESWSHSSGIKLSVYTTEPFVHFYTGKYIPQSSGKMNENQSFPYGPFAGFCVETQRAIDAINSNSFRESVIINKSKMYAQNTTFRFELI